MAVREASADQPYIRDKERIPMENQQIERVSREEKGKRNGVGSIIERADFIRPIGTNVRATQNMKRAVPLFHTT